MKTIEKLKKLLQVNEELEKQDIVTLKPCLIGKSGSGKTAIVKELGKELNLEVEVLLLQSMLSDEILGIPKVKEKNTFWSIPEWAVKHKEKFILFIDEFDKAKQDELSSILTLLISKTIRGIPVNCYIILAGQDEDLDEFFDGSSTAQAIRSRINLLKLEETESITYLEKKYSIELSELKIKDEKTDYHYIINPRVIDYLLAIASKLSPKEFFTLAIGVADKKLLELLWNKLYQTTELSEAIIKSLTLESVKERLKTPILAYNIGQIFRFCNPEIFIEAFKKVMKDGTSEEIKTLREKWFQYLISLAGENETEIEVLNGHSAEEFFPQLFKAINEEIIKDITWKEIKEK